MTGTTKARKQNGTVRQYRMHSHNVIHTQYCKDKYHMTMYTGLAIKKRPDFCAQQNIIMLMGNLRVIVMSLMFSLLGHSV